MKINKKSVLAVITFSLLISGCASRQKYIYVMPDPYQHNIDQQIALRAMEAQERQAQAQERQAGTQQRKSRPFRILEK